MVVVGWGGGAMVVVRLGRRSYGGWAGEEELWWLGWEEELWW